MFEHDLKSGRIPRIIDKKHTDRVKKLTCPCGNPADDPHHINGEQLGATGTKANDYLTFPVCRYCHDALHKNPKEFGYVSAQWKYVALALVELLTEDKLKI